MTNKQKEFLEIVKTMKKHPTAEDVYFECKKRGFNVSLASVYRILNKLAEEGKLRRVSEISEKDVYDTYVDDHEHLVCSRCGKVTDIKMNDFKKILMDKTGIEIDSFDLVMRYVCKECREKESVQKEGKNEIQM